MWKYIHFSTVRAITVVGGVFYVGVAIGSLLCGPYTLREPRFGTPWVYYLFLLLTGPVVSILFFSALLPSKVYQQTDESPWMIIAFIGCILVLFFDLWLGILIANPILVFAW